jgi:hypothetical protein
MRINKCIKHMKKVWEIAEECASAEEALQTLEKYIRKESDFTEEVRDSTPTVINTWLRSWGRSPATYSYRAAGGYEAFCHYKYLARRGMKAVDIPDRMRQIIKETYADAPEGALGEYTCYVPRRLLGGSEYEL